MAEQFYDQDFPNLRRLGVEQTSDPDSTNCVAFAIGDRENSWWPPKHRDFSDDRWPEEIPNVATVESFSRFFALHGFVECDNGEWEEGYEKLALYGIGDEPVHVAKQWTKDKWRSKLGPENEDIEHTLDGLVGPAYGVIIAYFTRPQS